ncbi:MAG: DUF4258 domain-containing protein [Nitrospiraceae bacterium]|nr:DUF4258 domain-containing protein [Nitrospiraceae bacterium]
MKRYSKAEALKVIRNILKNGAVIPSGHVQERMLQRGFDMQDILNVIRTGAIYTEPEIHPKTGRWTYKVEGKTIDGDKIDIVVDIDDKNNCIKILTGITH